MMMMILPIMEIAIYQSIMMTTTALAIFPIMMFTSRRLEMIPAEGRPASGSLVTAEVPVFGTAVYGSRSATRLLGRSKACVATMERSAADTLVQSRASTQRCEKSSTLINACGSPPRLMVRSPVK